MIRAIDADEHAQIARGLKERDPEAMAALYDACGPLVYGRIYSMVQNEGVAEDLVQEVFFGVWQRAKIFDETRGSLCTWLAVMARNRAIDYLRSRESQVECRASSIDLMPLCEGLLSPEQDAVRFDMFSRLRAAVSRLNLNQRTVLRLAFDEGMSHMEVARLLRRPLGTVKTQIRSAIQELRASMSACSGEA